MWVPAPTARDARRAVRLAAWHPGVSDGLMPPALELGVAGVVDGGGDPGVVEEVLGRGEDGTLDEAGDDGGGDETALTAPQPARSMAHMAKGKAPSLKILGHRTIQPTPPLCRSL